MKNYQSVGVLLLLAFLVDNADAREWVDASGSYKIEAEFVAVRDGQVWLKKQDGTVIHVPLDRLSTRDQRFARTEAKKQARAVTSEPSNQTPAPPGREPSGSPSTIRGIATAVWEALASPTDLQFENAPLHEAMEAISQKHGVEHFLDIRSMDDIGFSSQRPVRLSAARGSLQEALVQMLSPLSLVAIVKHDVLFITTDQTAERTLETRVYRLKQQVANCEVLASDITQKTAPASWDKMGGPGTIVAWPPALLVVRQTQSIHQQIAGSYASFLVPVDSASVAAPRRRTPDRRNGPGGALEKPVTVEFNEEPLESALGSLVGQTGLRVELDTKALADTGLASNVPVSLRLRGVPLQSAMSLLLESLGLTWQPAQDKLVVTTPEQAQANLLTVSHNIRNLGIATAQDAQRLAGMITSIVAPAEWVNVGGPGSIRLLPSGELSIQQTYSVQREVEKLLKDLQVAVAR